MKIPLHIAQKLWQLLQGESLAANFAKHALIEELIEEGIIQRKGRMQKKLLLADSKALHIYLQNKYAISDLQKYMQICEREVVSRSELVAVSSDSKLRKVRTFKGFLVTCYSPVEATLNGTQILLNPVEGTFQFIYDFEQFIPLRDVVIVGIENPENFRFIGKQKHLFSHINPLFVSRYPQTQNKDLLRWLASIPNQYLHYGDYDFAGINIYQNEFKKYLPGKAMFFIPPNINALLQQYGNKQRYDEQKISFDSKSIQEENLLMLIASIHKYRKGLDQEILIHSNQLP